MALTVQVTGVGEAVKEFKLQLKAPLVVAPHLCLPRPPAAEQAGEAAVGDGRLGWQCVVTQQGCLPAAGRAGGSGGSAKKSRASGLVAVLMISHIRQCILPLPALLQAHQQRARHAIGARWRAGTYLGSSIMAS